MAEKEMQAHDMVRRRSWSRAIALYDQILSHMPATVASNSAGGVSGGGASGSGSVSNGNSSSASTITRAQKDRQIACLLGRCECQLELNRYEHCLADARKVLALLTEQSVDNCLASVSRARRWLVHALCKLKKYTEAEQTLREWVTELSGQQCFADISKTLERYKSIIQTINSHHKSTPKMYVKLEDEMSVLDTKLDHWATNNLPLDKYSKLLSNKGLKKREGTTTSGSGGSATGVQNGSLSSNSSNHSSTSNGSSSTLSNSSGGSGNGIGGGGGSNNSTNNMSALQKTTELLAAIKVTGGKHMLEDQDSNATTCSYCAITFQTRNELRQHCQTESHQNVIMSDEGRDWKWRPPPRGFTLDTYSLCEAYSEAQSCHYGNQCVEAHGQDELNEWKERFEYRRMRLKKACEKELYGKSYTEQILDRWVQATAPERIMCDKVDDVELKCEQELATSISSKTSKREWLFVLKTQKPLKAVALLQDAHRNHFAIKAIKVAQALASSNTTHDVELKSNQEWVANKSIDKDDGKKKTLVTLDKETTNSTTPPITTAQLEHQVMIEFHTDIYGTFRQAICFDLGDEPMLVQNLCVDVVAVGEAEKIEEIKRDIINSSATRWDVANTNLVRFETTIGTHLKTEAYLNDLKHEKEMLERYPCPREETFQLTQSIIEKRLTQNNYRSRIHELLYVEEIARYDQIARFNVRTKLTVTSNYILTPAGMATSTAKYSLSGELFALMRLGKDISEDTSAGRLILSNCSSVYIAGPDEAHMPLSKEKKRDIYEALIEDKGKNVIYLKLSAKCVEGMSLKADTDIDVDIQFQLNRLPYCEWHNAVDKITDFKIIFPATEIEPNIPWTPKKQWSESCEPKLNAKQREAVNAITTSLSIKLPPILLIGPFGTGKTYTLAQAIKQLLTQPEAKILICTHSNSAADLYIKEYLHPWIEDGLTEATPLRVYYHKRWVATVNSVVQKYCITDGAGNFRRPTMEDIMKHRIVVVTLSISMELAGLGLPKGYFTHIFLDEAAQAMECEAIMPLALANDTTRIVLAGDHMQMSPELFSAFAKDRKLHISLLERLYDHYPSNFPCKILLCENYRAHEAIIKFTSELFYEQKLIASGKQPRHDRFYPLTFFTTRGEDVQDKNSTAFYNNAEVYEVVERVSELRKRWPTSWGKINDTSIGIMTPYADQVFRIRSELRKRRMGGISVERVLNVQGKQFRAIFLSTVRTRRTCLPQGAGNYGQPAQTSSSPTEDADYGFLSNSKLLNTAITRAQSLVAVVGDPVALCSIGRCRKVWERFIEICDENKSLYGITWSFLRSQLDGVELKRGYVLNPLAPEFIPRALQPESYLYNQPLYLVNTSAAAVAAATAAATAAAAGKGVGGGSGPHVSGVGGPHHNSVPMPPHAGMLSAPGGGGGPMLPHHAAAAAVMNNAQIPPHMYAQHPAAAAAVYNAAAMMQHQGMAGVGGGGGKGHLPPPPNHMGMRALGPHQPNGPQQQQQPPPQPPYNARGPPPPNVHLSQPLSAGAQFPPYMSWQQAQQQQLRGATPGGIGGGYAPPIGQQPPPGQLSQNQNPNANLWGPPPQSNPWSALPKQPLNGAGAAAVNGRPQQQPPPGPPQSTPIGMRGSSVPLQAVAPPPQAPPNQQPPQLRTNPSDLGGYLAKKSLYGPPNAQSAALHANWGANTGAGGGSNNQLPILSNQRGLGPMPNGPISPMEPPYLQRPPGNAGGAPGAAIGNAVGATNGSFYGGMKDKEYQFLNSMPHMPPLYQNAAAAAAANNKQQSPTALRYAAAAAAQSQDYAMAAAATGLLPPNMNIYEMAYEPKESQYKWYLKLIETQGQDAANKFTEVLRQVMNMLPQPQHQQPPPQLGNKHTPPQLGVPLTGSGGVGPMLPRELMAQQQQQQQQPGMPPPTAMMGGGNGLPPHPHQPQPPQAPQNRPNSMHQYMHGTPGGLLSAAQQQPQPPHQPQVAQQQQAHASSALLPSNTHRLDEAPPPLDGGNIHFNQHIDLVFNSLMNGNEIAEPILRDLLGMVGGSGNNGSHSAINTNVSLINGDLLNTSGQQQQQQHSKLFPALSTSMNNLPHMPTPQPQQQQKQQQAGVPPPPMHLYALQHMQQQQQQQALSASQMGGGNFMGNALLNSKDMLLGAVNNSSGANSSLSGGLGASVPLYRRQGVNMSNGHLGSAAGNSINYNGNAAAATPDNVLTGGSVTSAGRVAIDGSGNGTNELLAGLGTTGTGNLIEALFQSSEHQQQPQQPGLLAGSSYQKMLYNDLDLYMRDHHHHQQQQQQQQQQHQQQQANVVQNLHNNSHYQHNNAHAMGGAVNVGMEQRNTTYAAVLSQGPGTQPAAVGAHHNYHVDAGVGVGVSTDLDKDPFAAIRELGQGTNGYYNYFQ